MMIFGNSVEFLCTISNTSTTPLDKMTYKILPNDIVG